MKRGGRGQGAFEFIMLYLWAMIIVGVIGIVIFGSGLFGHGVTQEDVSKFTTVFPDDFAFYNTGTNSSVAWRQSGETRLANISLNYSGHCNATTSLGELRPGRSILDEFDCNTQCDTDEPIVVDIDLSYTTGTGRLINEFGVIKTRCSG
ncbi:MAG: hypothetical protein J4432_03800 [DPANN group archaeon]|nr:hypothetical protein [DPANN group archaeon]